MLLQTSIYILTLKVVFKQLIFGFVIQLFIHILLVIVYQPKILVRRIHLVHSWLHLLVCKLNLVVHIVHGFRELAIYWHFLGLRLVDLVDLFALPLFLSLHQELLELSPDILVNGVDDFFGVKNVVELLRIGVLLVIFAVLLLGVGGVSLVVQSFAAVVLATVFVGVLLEVRLIVFVAGRRYLLIVLLDLFVFNVLGLLLAEVLHDSEYLAFDVDDGLNVAEVVDQQVRVAILAPSFFRSH